MESPSLSSVPTSPRRRHIHSSFPHYFYCTPMASSSPPSSHSISAFVTLCESRINNPNSDNNISALPLKLPPRLQYIANIRKSLRLPRFRRKVSSPRLIKFRKDIDDPFAVAVEKVRKEDAPWCQLPRNRRSTKIHRKSNESREREREREREAIVEYIKSAIKKRNGNDQEESDGLILCQATCSSSSSSSSICCIENRKESWISRVFENIAVKGKRRSKVEDEGEGKLVKSANCTSLGSYGKAQGYFKFLACFRFK